MKSDVLKFLQRTGNPPKDYVDIDSDSLKEKMLARIALHQEELNEAKAALEAGDWVEVLDAFVDRKYFLIQDELDLEAAGFSIEFAEEAVCLNNELKYTTSYYYIERELSKSSVDYSIRGSSATDDYDWQSLFYCLVDSTGKVRKMSNHPKVDLSPYVPNKFKKIIPTGDWKKDVTCKENYDKLVSSGMAWELYPTLPLSWEGCTWHTIDLEGDCI